MSNIDLHVSRGPVSSMPGSAHNLPEGTMCDEHQDRPAVVRIQGETDSFGAEYHCMCQECKDQYAAEKAAMGGGNHIGNCSCGALNVPLFALRDYEEGSSGPLYYKCQACKTAWHKREAEEADRYWEERGDIDDIDDSRFDDDDYDELDLGPAEEDPQPGCFSNTVREIKPPVISYKRRRRVIGPREG